MQTAGRGRHGRQWHSLSGNFFGSLVVSPCVPSVRYGEYSFLAAVVLRDVIAAQVAEPIALKWPNDVLVSGKKCAGILIDVVGDNLILGMGVNLLHAPQASDVSYPVAALGIRDKMAFTQTLCSAWTHWHQDFANHGFERVRSAWLQYAHQLGMTITLQISGQTCSGIFAGVDRDGSLLLTQGAHTRKVTAADVLA